MGAGGATVRAAGAAEAGAGGGGAGGEAGTLAATFGGGYVFDGTGMAGDLGAVSAHGLVLLSPPGGPLPIPYPTNVGAVGTLTLTSTGPSAGAVLSSVTLALSAPSPVASR